ncbi:glycine cleavage system aminomethyltransferase GcvT [Saccharibacter sp. 17.LH.SD]|uniref:glycine cleavage system aminomethyltransferase GcvT n=1 Tax=Saccharibacter sp. 17.LH.SD TaxID=2689393 RepID=UPI0013718749|nr:glycine cleavage system aminomethyltransferase GcvT [Saccharibacter sp. 17.LH.SD]MXV45121.1 glycine cleavage system aminomethyltransferase GcvT [Saccharibacter sp. 17.LH.SD]
MNESLQRTPLYDLHISLGAKMVPFAGYEMPVQYPLGVMEEHQHTRKKAGLFDVSHMGQLRIQPRQQGNGSVAAEAFEALVPMDFQSLPVGRQRYALLTNDQGGLRDDLMVARQEGGLFVVVNAANKESDADYIEQALAESCKVKRQFDRALLALQGPKAVEVIADLFPQAPTMRFMDCIDTVLDGAPVTISRSGYTGEDGFEIGLPAELAERVARKLLEHPDVEAVGLGARDSLRLEAGLCLYGQDIDKTTSPVEASLMWAIQKVRRPGGERAGGYPGAETISRQLEDGVYRKRVGLVSEGRAPIRAGVELFADETGEEKVGRVTSGGFGPTVQGPVAMGYVSCDKASPETRVFASLRGRMVPVTVKAMPFVPPGFKR